MKLKEALTVIDADHVVLCIPSEIIAKKTELHKLKVSTTKVYKIDTASKLNCPYTTWDEAWRNRLMAILTVEAWTSDMRALPLYENKQADDIVRNLNVEEITTHESDDGRPMIAIILK